MMKITNIQSNINSDSPHSASGIDMNSERDYVIWAQEVKKMTMKSPNKSSNLDLVPT